VRNVSRETMKKIVEAANSDIDLADVDDGEMAEGGRCAALIPKGPRYVTVHVRCVDAAPRSGFLHRRLAPGRWRSRVASSRDPGSQLLAAGGRLPRPPRARPAAHCHGARAGVACGPERPLSAGSAAYRDAARGRHVATSRTFCRLPSDAVAGRRGPR